MIVEWTQNAEGELHEAMTYIAERNPVAAFELFEKIVLTTEMNLSEHPNMGRQGRVENTRELIVHENYIVAYRVQSDRVQILALRHSSQLWPQNF